MLDNLTTMIAQQMFISQSVQIKTNSIEVNFLKDYASNIPNNVDIQDCAIRSNSICEMIADSFPNTICENIVILQRVS